MFTLISSHALVQRTIVARIDATDEHDLRVAHGYRGDVATMSPDSIRVVYRRADGVGTQATGPWGVESVYVSGHLRKKNGEIGAQHASKEFTATGRTHGFAFGSPAGDPVSWIAEFVAANLPSESIAATQGFNR